MLRPIAFVALAISTMSLEVLTDKGVVSGNIQRARGVFHGIPFAKPPVGARRFMPTEEEESWKGVKGGKRPVCIQPGSPGTGLPKGWDTIHVEGSSEDCLYLSVYAPLAAKNFRSGLPVLVYFHAGEFLYGSSNDDETNFPWFSRDVVLVTPNSRLGVFGYGAHPKLAALNSRNTTGNYGMLDQQQALRWVQRNIKQFGGDPSKVTILGESSGGTAVAYHVTNPRSWGLFATAVAQSPGLYQTQTLPHAIVNTEYLATLVAHASHETGLGRGPCDAGAWKELPNVVVDTKDVTLLEASKTEESVRQMCVLQQSCKGYARVNETWVIYRSAAPIAEADDTMTLHLKWITQETLLKCLKKADPAVAMGMSGHAFPYPDDFWTDQFAPVVDGVELKDGIPELMQKQQIAPKVKVIMGSNLDEATMMMYHVPEISCNATYKEFTEWVEDFYGEDHVKRITELYTKVRMPIPQCSHGPGHWRAAAIRVAGDDAILCPLKAALAAITKDGTRAGYHYYFTHTPSVSGNYEDTTTLGSFHGAEVPYVFGYPRGMATPYEWDLHKNMKAFWSNFMLSGNPNTGGKVPLKWPEFTSSRQPCMVFGTPPMLVVENFVQSPQCNAFATMRGTPVLAEADLPLPCPPRLAYRYTGITPATTFTTALLFTVFMFCLHKCMRSTARSPRQQQPLPQ